MKPFTTAKEYSLHRCLGDYYLRADRGKCSGCGGDVFGSYKFCGTCGKSLAVPQEKVITLGDIQEYLNKRYHKFGLRCLELREVKGAARVEGGVIRVALACASCGAASTGGYFCTACGAKTTPLEAGSEINEPKEEIVKFNNEFLLDVYKSKHPSPSDKYICTIEVYPEELGECASSVPMIQFFTDGGMTPEEILNSSSFDNDVWKHTVYGDYHGISRMDWSDKYPTAILTPAHLSEVFELSIEGLELEFEDEAQLLDRIRETEDPETNWVYHRQFDIECEHCGIAWAFHAYIYVRPIKED